MMKTSKMLFTLFLLFSAVSLSPAAIWTVNNVPNSAADFTQPQEAHDDERVVPGDSIYVVGSVSNYGTVSTTKSLNWFGPGYFLDENPDTQARNLQAFIPNGFSLYPGSEGSMVTGIRSVFHVLCSQVVLKRNQMSLGIHNHEWQGEYYIVSDVSVIQSYIDGFSCNPSHRNIHNIRISNNVFASSLNWDNYCSGTVRNNVFLASVSVQNAILYNNISGASFSDADGRNNFWHHNISNHGSWADANPGIDDGNITGVDLSSVFVGPEIGSTDGQWMIQDDCIAVGAAADGGDCGARDYVLSGIPAIPTITEFWGADEGSEQEGLEIHVIINARD